MKIVSTALTGSLLAAALFLAPTPQAKADGGVVIGVGAYLVGDYVVGRKCRMRAWPLNIVKTVAYGLSGRRACRYRRY